VAVNPSGVAMFCANNVAQLLPEATSAQRPATCIETSLYSNTVPGVELRGRVAR
jgi:hypothetical protein